MAAGAAASPAYAAASTASLDAAVPAKAVSLNAGPVLAAPVLDGAGPLAVPAFAGPAPLATAAIGGRGIGGSPLASPAPVPAGSHPVPAASPRQPAPSQPSASPSTSATPGQQPGNSVQSGNSRQAAPQKPYQFYDSVEPQDIPAGQNVATYATGPFSVSQAEVAGRGKVFWIDTNGTDPNADALDTEPGDATPAMAASWAYRRLKAHPNSLACIYTALAEWPSVQAETSALPAWMQSRIRWWIANPTGVEHLVPGSDATQWYWGSTYDISTAKTRL